MALDDLISMYWLENLVNNQVGIFCVFEWSPLPILLV